MSMGQRRLTGTREVMYVAFSKFDGSAGKVDKLMCPLGNNFNNYPTV